jgi:protocatechuate 3,4-dioxygenase, alpha subunit
VTAPTPSQTVGPFFSIGLTTANHLAAPDDPRARRVDGRVLDGADAPVPDAMVEVFHADVGFGRCITDVDGSYSFVVASPGGGQEAPHLDVSVFARGLLQRVATRLYLPEETEANAVDPVLTSIADDQVRATLIAQPVDGGLRFDIHLQGPRETAFFEL